MATQTGSIDLKAAKKAHDDAAKVATNYLSFGQNTGLDVGASGLSSKVNIKADGVRIYDENGNIGNYVSSGGMGVYQDGKEIASFGSEMRLGSLNDANNVVIDANSININAYTGSKVFQIQVPNDAATETYYTENYTDGHNYTSMGSDTLITTPITVSSSTSVSSQTKTITDSVLQNILADISTDEEFVICVAVYAVGSNTGIGMLPKLDDMFKGAHISYHYLTFTKKTSGTFSLNHTDSYGVRRASDDVVIAGTNETVTVTYNASTNVFTLQVSASRIGSEMSYKVYAFIDTIGFNKEVLKSNAYINGDVYLNSGLTKGEPVYGFGDLYVCGANTYMYVDTSESLWDAICELGWENYTNDPDEAGVVVPE